MFYSIDLKATDIAERVRTTDPIDFCANSLREEAQLYEFYLKNLNTTAKDLQISFDMYQKNRPVKWERFFKKLLATSEFTDEKRRGCDTVFQILYSLINNCNDIPLTIALAQLIHKTYRSKDLYHHL